MSKKIILLCKGNSINQLTKTEILNNDIIVWANIHNYVKFSSLIPDKVDYLFIREKSFVDDLLENEKNDLLKLNIPHVITTGKSCRKILTYDVEKHVSSNTIGFNGSASTGLIALDFLTSLKPTELTVAGLDLFQKNKSLYYFNDINNNLGSVETNKSLNNSTNDDGVLMGNGFHYPDRTIQHIKLLIKNHDKIKFKFYSENVELVNNIKDLKNVEIL